MNNAFSKFSRTLRFSLGAASISSLGGAMYGCSSSSNSAAPSVTTDASILDGTIATESGVATLVDGSTPDSTADSASTIVQQIVTETKLVADTAEGGAPTVDPALVNPWGLAFNPSGPAWIADNGTGLLTVWNGQVLGLQVTVPPPPGDAAGPAAPSGQIFNAAHATAFDGDVFIVATEDGTVSGWQPLDGSTPTTATLRIDNSGANAVYKGLAILPTAPLTLAVADFHNNKISLFDTSYDPVKPDSGIAWTDPTVPAGYAPFNIVAIGTSVYVAFAKQDAAMHDGLLGPGEGALSVFTPTGTLVKSLVSVNGPLSSPWGIVVAPAVWGSLGGSLLVGNFGGGAINAFNPTTGVQLGQLASSSGSPLAIGGLWGLAFSPIANPDAGITTSQLYFTAGPNAEMDGLFGFLTPAP